MISANQTAPDSRRASSSAGDLAAFVPLFREIGNLKRLRAAGSDRSFAAELFRRAWSQIADVVDADARTIAVKITAEAIVGANLGAITVKVLREAELAETEIELILRRAFDAAAIAVPENLRAELREQITAKIDRSENKIIDFVDRLIAQPRSGATKVGAPKLVFDAPENHAEHSIVVGIYAVLLAPVYAADVETVFYAALAHHFHNAFLPDSGFAGEEHLGEFLPQIFEAFRRRCLAEIPENLHDKIRQALKTIETADAPEAKAFHAADVIDRVLQMRHHAEANEFTLQYALETAELVHAGAVQTFHYDVLRAAQLIR